MVALFVLWGLRPWEDDAAAPHEVPLGIEAAVDGGKALSAAPAAGVAAGVAVPAGPKVQAAQRASGDAGSTPNSGGLPETIAVVPARPIAIAGPPQSPTGAAPGPGGDEGVPSVGASPVVAPPEGTPSSGTTPAGTSGGSSGGPVTAGGNPVAENCEGDEYTITVTFLDEESTVEEAPVEIVLEQLNEDGSTDELQLEGDLSDVHALASTLEAEGNCVKVEIAQPEAEESAEEVPGTSEEASESGEEVTDPTELPVPSSP